MIIFTWLITTVLFVTAIFLLAWSSFKDPRKKKDLQTLWAGFKEGLKGSGLNVTKTRYPVELYKWKTADDEEVCEDCLERSFWPPMDIADWMKEGVPKSPEADTACGENCRCRLILHKKTSHFVKKNP